MLAPWQEMVAEIQAWDELAQRAAEPNPFYESWYLLPSLQSFGNARNATFICYFRAGRLAGLLPIVRYPRYGRWPLAHFSNWLHHNVFFGTPLVEAGAESDFWRALLSWADVNAARSLFLQLHEIAFGGPVYEALASVLAADGREWGIVQRRKRALLMSNLDAEAYLERSLPARNRKDLNRRFRRLSELGQIDFRWETGTDNLLSWIDQFLSLEASGWKGEAGSALASDAATEVLFRESMAGAAARGRLSRLSLRVNDRPIAMLSTFLSPPGAFGFKTAYDEHYARFAPGLLLEREFLTALRRLGISWCDSCAPPDHSVMNRIWQERRALGRISIAIGGPLRRATFARILRRETARLDQEAHA